MEMHVFSIYDKATKVFNTPFFMLRREEALRAFKELVQDERTTISKHPEDFMLFDIGWFDTEKGELGSWPPEKVCTALDFPVVNKDQLKMELVSSEEVSVEELRENMRVGGDG